MKELFSKVADQVESSPATINNELQITRGGGGGGSGGGGGGYGGGGGTPKPLRMIAYLEMGNK